jgi:hypothetical protein
MSPLKPNPKVLKALLLLVLILAIAIILIDRMTGPSI